MGGTGDHVKGMEDGAVTQGPTTRRHMSHFSVLTTHTSETTELTLKPKTSLKGRQRRGEAARCQDTGLTWGRGLMCRLDVVAP